MNFYNYIKIKNNAYETTALFKNTNFNRLCELKIAVLGTCSKSLQFAFIIRQC